MTIEAILQSIDGRLAELNLILQTGASAVHAFGSAVEVATTAAPTAAKVSRKAKETVTETPPVVVNLLGLVEGDPDGTRYWLIEQHNTVYAQKPGDPDPQIASAVITTAAQYAEKKAEYAKKSVIPPVTVAPTAAPASVSAPVVTASTVSSNAETPSFKDVTDKLIALSKDTRPERGRPALEQLLAKYLPALEVKSRTVPKLADLGKNAEIIAEVVALLAPDAVEAEVDIFG